jgi:hypothetical protein
MSWGSPPLSALSPGRQEVLASVDQAKDLDLGAHAINHAVALDDQFATRETNLGHYAPHLWKRGQGRRGGLQAFEKIGGGRLGFGLLGEVLNGVEEILSGEGSPGYRRPSHSRASRITCS